MSRRVWIPVAAVTAGLFALGLWLVRGVLAWRAVRHATVEAERLADELETANHFRDRLAERLEVVAVAVTELECALSFTNYANDPDHWRGHVESALEMCKRATRARADRTEGTPQEGNA